jgi:hypothetical protein
MTKDSSHQSTSIEELSAQRKNTTDKKAVLKRAIKALEAKDSILDDELEYLDGIIIQYMHQEGFDKLGCPSGLGKGDFEIQTTKHQSIKNKKEFVKWMYLNDQAHIIRVDSCKKADYSEISKNEEIPGMTAFEKEKLKFTPRT